MANKITKQELRDELERLAEDLDRTPTARQMDDIGEYSSGTYLRRFGSWTEAVEGVGLTPNYTDPPTPPKNETIPTEDLLVELQRLEADLGRTPSQNDMGEVGEYGATTYRDRFGTWNNALEEAGFEPNHPVDSHKYSGERGWSAAKYTPPIKIETDELIQELQRLSNDVGRTPTSREMDELGEYSFSTYRNRFGTWNDAVEEAGLDANTSPQSRVSRDGLLDDLHRLEDDLGRAPRFQDIEDHGKYGKTTYINWFGTWMGALREAGFEHNPRQKIPDQDLIDEILRLKEELGRNPTTTDMESYGVYSKQVYTDRFGAWVKALESAGIDTYDPRAIPKDDLLDELRRLAEELGRPPRAIEMNNIGRHYAASYYRWFDSWDDVLKSIGCEPYGPLSGETHPRWNGGVENYGKGWDERKREAVRKRDERSCQNCGRPEEEHIAIYGKKHSVHHIRKARNFECAEKRNHMDNLVTLCESKECHKKWEKMSPLRPQVAGE